MKLIDTKHFDTIKYKLACKKNITLNYLNTHFDQLKRNTYTIYTSNTPYELHTIVNGKKETSRIINKNDVVICGINKELYGMGIKRFEELYHINDKYATSKCIVKSVSKLNKGFFKNNNLQFTSKYKFKAKWGLMIFHLGDYLVKTQYIDKSIGYYIVDKDIFRKTYKYIKR